jgi:hypothetical protein
MTRAQEVLQDLAETHEAGEHIEALKRPIRIPFWSFAFLLTQGGLASPDVS